MDQWTQTEFDFEDSSPTTRENDRLPLTLEAYDQCRAELIAWLESVQRFDILDLPLFDHINRSVRLAVLLDVMEAGIIRFEHIDRAWHIFDEKLLPGAMPRRSAHEMHQLRPDVQNAQDRAYIPSADEVLTPRAQAKRTARLRIELARVREVV